MEIKGEREVPVQLTWQPSQPTWQPTGRPSTVLARASHLLPLARQAERSTPARARAPRHQAACLRRLATATPRVFSPAPSRLPGPPRSLPLPRSPPLSRSLTLHRTRPPPPFAVAATTAVPTMPRAAPELLRLVTNPLTEPHDRKSPGAPPRCFPPRRLPRIAVVKFVAARPSPSSPSIPRSST